MAEPQWAQNGERAVGDGNTDGLDDTMNRAAKQFYELYKKRHNDDGTHKLTGFCLPEIYSYTGTGSAHAESLVDSDLEIVCIQIHRVDTEYPVVTCTAMSSDETKQVGTNAFQSGMITSIATAGEFSVGTDAAVNASGVDYVALIWGTH